MSRSLIFTYVSTCFLLHQFNPDCTVFLVGLHIMPVGNGQRHDVWHSITVKRGRANVWWYKYCMVQPLMVWHWWKSTVLKQLNKMHPPPSVLSVKSHPACCPNVALGVLSIGRKIMHWYTFLLCFWDGKSPDIPCILIFCCCSDGNLLMEMFLNPWCKSLCN